MSLIKLTSKRELRDLIFNGISTEKLKKNDYLDITNMSYMLENCTSLITVPLFNTANVTNTNGMFKNCTSLLTVARLNTLNVQYMESMFGNCKSLTDIDLSIFELYALSELNNPFLRNKYSEYYISNIINLSCYIGKLVDFIEKLGN